MWHCTDIDTTIITIVVVVNIRYFIIQTPAKIWKHLRIAVTPSIFDRFKQTLDCCVGRNMQYVACEFHQISLKIDRVMTVFLSKRLCDFGVLLR